jgi:hypothetical protein
MQPISAGDGGWLLAQAAPIQPALKSLRSQPPSPAQSSTRFAEAGNQHMGRVLNCSQLCGIELSAPSLGGRAASG